MYVSKGESFLDSYFTSNRVLITCANDTNNPCYHHKKKKTFNTTLKKGKLSLFPSIYQKRYLSEEPQLIIGIFTVWPLDSKSALLTIQIDYLRSSKNQP